jgi:hypothetical protein
MAYGSRLRRAVWANARVVMITATFTRTDTRNFEENATGYQRAQLA